MIYGIHFLCFYTGVRKGEALALKWEDINFITNEIYINKLFIISIKMEN